jgi:hypothetical protein
MPILKFEDLKGQTLTAIKNFDDEQLALITKEGNVYRLYHEQDCCECVRISDICGDLADLIGEPLLEAEEVCSEVPQNEEEYAGDSQTWTFYKLTTRKGSVTIRWLGESNGYYSESVDFEKITNPREQFKLLSAILNTPDPKL